MSSAISPGPAGTTWARSVSTGRSTPPDTPRPTFMAPYPYLLADCGDIDITGHRLPVSYYREIVFGLRAQPYLAVQRPQHHGKTVISSQWAWSDTIASWTWPGHESAPIIVEVYRDADDVELLVNGRSLGRKPVREQHRFRTEFEITYEPGELVAIAYRDGVESGAISSAPRPAPSCCTPHPIDRSSRSTSVTLPISL
ncbi:DUF4982 domain-containing protein [Nonomuraea sp. NPDC049269]|uniref:DUF4982 domain-containing protein n=1 Tax=Nonomuraea sp. NPDC049269 TaxID=3364349 RepID=UPI00371ACE75